MWDKTVPCTRIHCEYTHTLYMNTHLCDLNGNLLDAALQVCQLQRGQRRARLGSVLRRLRRLEPLRRRYHIRNVLVHTTIKWGKNSQQEQSAIDRMRLEPPRRRYHIRNVLYSHQADESEARSQLLSRLPCPLFSHQTVY
jgi:hypothetical protein